MSDYVKISVRTLLAGIVDYAGLFPPSQLSMGEAVLNYATYHNSNLSWMLGRFVIPAARLDEFVAEGRDFYSAKRGEPWKLSVIDGGNLFDTLRAVEDFNAANGLHARVDTLEIKATSPDDIYRAAEILPGFLTPFFEIATDEETLSELIPPLVLTKQNAKVRTGGVTPEAIPVSADVARFMRTCLAAGVTFKATAGLHHPLRAEKPLTYAPDAVKDKMHGFLNVFLAAAFIREGFKPTLVAEILDEESGDAFTFDDNGLWWRQEYFLGLPQLRRLRERNLVSFGSCSFTEPTEELQDLGIL
jgi:hypothetical protein